MESDEEIEKSKNYIFQIDMWVIFLFLYGIINNLIYDSPNKNYYPIWYIGPLCIIFMSIFSHNLYKNIYIRQTLFVNSFFYALLVGGGWIALFYSTRGKDISIYILSSMSILLGLCGSYLCKKYFSKN